MTKGMNHTVGARQRYEWRTMRAKALDAVANANKSTDARAAGLLFTFAFTFLMVL